MGIYEKTATGAVGLSVPGISDIYEKTVGGAVKLWSAGVPAVPITDLPDGARIRIPSDIGGADVHLIKLLSNYENSGRLLVLRKDTAAQLANPSSDIRNNYANSMEDVWCETTYFNSLPTAIQALIEPVTIPYTIGNGNWSLSSLSRKVFLLSLSEFSCAQSSANIEGTAIPYFDSNAKRIAYFNGVADKQRTRTPYTGGVVDMFHILATGVPQASVELTGAKKNVRPATTLPATAMVDPTPNADGSYNLVEHATVYINYKEYPSGKSKTWRSPFAVGSNVKINTSEIYGAHYKANTVRGKVSNMDIVFNEGGENDLHYLTFIMPNEDVEVTTIDSPQGN